MHHYASVGKRRQKMGIIITLLTFINRCVDLLLSASCVNYSIKIQTYNKYLGSLKKNLNNFDGRQLADAKSEIKITRG